MKIKSKFNLVLGILLFMADAYIVYNGIANGLTSGMVWYMFISHFGAAFYAREWGYLNSKDNHVMSIILVPGVIAFLGNMTKEWENKYWFLLALPSILFVGSIIIGFFLHRS